VSDIIDASLTPVFITFTDTAGRLWRALALLAPLNSEDMEPVILAETQDLGLKVKGVKIVRR
jgi:hypothetical protein